MRDLPYFTHEEYELMKMPLAREEVPDGALAALSACIGMWRRAGSWCRYERTPPTLSLSRCSQPEARR